MSLSFKTEGILHKIEPEQQITDTFKKKNIVVEVCDNPMYKEYVTFELVQDSCGLVKDLNCGDKVEISFNIRGREYQDKNSGELKYFNSLRCWKISKIDNLTSEQQSSSMVEDDLPF